MTRRLLTRAAQLLVLATAGWFVYRALAPELAKVSRSDLAAWRPAALPLATSFLLLLAMYLLHAFLWRRVMQDLAIGNPSARNTVRVYFLAGLGRYVPGKVWQLAGMAVLAGRAGLPPIKATAAAVLGQVAFLAMGMLFLALTFPGWQDALGGAGAVPGWAIAAAVLLFAGGAALWVLAASSLGHGAREWLLRRVGPDRAGKLKSAFELADRVGLRQATVWAAAYALSWVVLGAAFTLFVGAFSTDAMASWRFLCGVVAASYLVGYAVPLPAGVGGREAVMVLLLQPLLGPAGAVVVSVLSRFWFTAGELVPLMLLPVLATGPESELRA